MHYTLHLTSECNMKCHYCYVSQKPLRMTLETAYSAVDNAVKSGHRNLGLVFFGGEPLLCKELIKDIITYSKKKADDIGNIKFHYKITTNGLLLDEEFINLANNENIYIALSIDGIAEAHNAHRLDASNRATHDRIENAAKLLLKNRLYAPALMTVNPDTVKYYYKSVEYLYDIGFQYIICSLNYAADWNAVDLKELEKQYKLLAEFYYKHTIAEDKFYLSPFEVKISSHINNRTYCHERCELGQKQLSVGPDGTIYPCVQFVGDEIYSIGNVFEGIDEEKRGKLFLRNELEKTGCDICGIKGRCNHYCACLNKQATGNIDIVSPVLCAHERIILPIADRAAARLYKKRSGMFIQKHYNDHYPMISLVEDRTQEI